MSDSIPNDLSVVLCDMCSEEDRKPAKKTCMKCEMSMCVQHIQDHLTTPFLLQTHPLTEPMALCGTSKCPLHGKLLEYYCLDDLTCVCVSCAIEDQHRLHNMKTFSSAHEELKQKLSSEHQALLVRTDDDNVSLEKWEKSEREKLGRCSVRLIEAVSSLRDVVLTSVQGSVSARMVSLKTSKSSMQAAQSEKDTFRFLQMYSKVREDLEKAKAADLRKGLEPSSDRDKLVEELRQGGEKMVKQADQFWCSLLTHVDPENHQQFFNTGSELFFDPESWTSAMSLSQDKRKVFYSSWLGVSNAILLIHGVQAVANVKRWTVNLSRDCDWEIGIGDNASASNHFTTVYGLCCKGEKVSLLKTAAGIVQWQTASVKNEEALENVAAPRPEIVEVCWSDVDSSLRFFSRPSQHQREEIITIKISPHGDLVPFIKLTTPSSGSSFGGQNFGQQKRWSCSCGVVCTKISNGKKKRSLFQVSSQSRCTCGALIGSIRTTMMLCELL